MFTRWLFACFDRKYADIAPLLDVDDMVRMKNPDWKCVFTYVQSFYRKFNSPPYREAWTRDEMTWRDVTKESSCRKKTWVRDSDVTWHYHLIHCVCNHVMHRRSSSHAMRSSARHVTTAARHLIGWRQRLAIRRVFKLICNLHILYYLCTREWRNKLWL